MQGREPTIEVYSPDGTIVKKLVLAKNDRMPVGEQPWFNAMGVFGNDVVLRRPDARELFQVYRFDHRRFQTRRRYPPRAAHCYARQPGLELRTNDAMPDCVPWARSRGSSALARLGATLRIHRLPRTGRLVDDKVAVPDDLAGIYVLKVTPEAEPATRREWLRNTASMPWLKFARPMRADRSRWPRPTIAPISAADRISR